MKEGKDLKVLLNAPFPPCDVEWRVSEAGTSKGKPWAMVLAYLTNRAIQDRLDDVFGPENWESVFAPGPHGGVMCSIRVRVGDIWVSKSDGADLTEFESIKGGYSSAMKRAAVQWGIGRYLYKLDRTFAVICEKKDALHYQKAKTNAKYDNKNYPSFYWRAPELPGWARSEM